MDTIKLWARNGDAVRQAIELGELVHLDTASEELTDEFLLFAIQSGLLAKWADAFPDPRSAPEISMEGILASHLAARFAGLYSMRKAGYVLRSASVLGALGYSIEVLEPEQGLSLRGTSDDKLISGDVLRKLLVQLENHVDLNDPLRVPPYEPSLSVKVRKRASRRRVATKLVDWYNDTVGPSLLQSARVGPGRRLHIVDTTHVEVPLETGTYEGSGVVKNDDGSRSRGYKLATLRTLLDHAGLITQVGLCPMQVHDLPVCRLFFETAPVLRAGDLVLEDRGVCRWRNADVSQATAPRRCDCALEIDDGVVSRSGAVGRPAGDRKN
jgi:hypothetical protein